MNYKTIITNALLLAVCAAWSYPFTCILLYGTHVVQEPSRLILYGELSFFGTVAVFGIVNIVREWLR